MNRNLKDPAGHVELSRLFYSALALSVFCFVVIVFGSWVRATDSGLACPDWPLCFGKVLPAFDLQIFLEWFHRIIAGLLTLGFFIFMGRVFS